MLFRKKIERSCDYCSYATKLNNNELLCMRRGFVTSDSACRKFKYDPCKRVPPKPKTPDFSKFDEEDFSL